MLYYFDRVKTALYYRLRNELLSEGIISPPQMVLWDCTRNCNLSCKYCGSPERYEHELDTPQMLAILKTFKDYGIPYIAATGGEPLTRPDLLDIFKQAKAYGMRTGITTNGTLITKENVAELISTMDYITISIDGVGPVNDCLRGKGSFERIVSGIDLLGASGFKGLALTTVVTPHNINGLTELRDYLKQFKFHTWRIMPVMPIGRVDKSMYLSTDQLKQLIGFVGRTKYATFGEDIGYLHKYDYVKKKLYPCPAGLDMMCLGATGHIRGCASLPDTEGYREGNVLATPVKDIWEHGFSRYRNKSQSCSNCKNWSYCRGGCWAMRIGSRHCNLSWCI